MNLVDIQRLRDIAAVEFNEIVEEAYSSDLNELRIVLKDGSFIDVWFSLKLRGRYSYHWERKAIDKTVYRHDNAPHKRWQVVRTFPKHFHEGNEEHVIESYISENPEQGLREFLRFVKNKLRKM